jgi:hypothetical protein
MESGLLTVKIDPLEIEAGNACQVCLLNGGSFRSFAIGLVGNRGELARISFLARFPVVRDRLSWKLPVES